MMRIQVFVNLKRFDIPRTMGGVCPSGDPAEWISGVIERSVELGLGASPDLALTYLLPEALILPARSTLDRLPSDRRSSLALGCQDVYREDVSPGGNFGAFTANLPATAAVNLGCSWSMIGHSEERRDKLGVIEAFHEGASANPAAHEAVDGLIGAEVSAALRVGLNVLLCIGEAQSQRADVGKVLERQIALGLGSHREEAAGGRIAIGYEPVWAIGPGRTPPEADEIGRIAEHVERISKDQLGVTVPVVYGGGLKRENAAGIASQKAVSGGLVALTSFSGEIGFDPEGLDGIIDCYREGARTVASTGAES